MTMYIKGLTLRSRNASSNDKPKPLRYSYYKKSGPVRLGTHIYADAWASRDRSGVQLNIKYLKYLIKYLGNRLLIIVVTCLMPPQIIVPGPLESHAFMVRLKEISIVNNTLLRGHNSSLV